MELKQSKQKYREIPRGVVNTNEISLSRVALRKGITSVPLLSLDQTDLVHRFSKDFHSGTVVWDIVLLNLLHNVIGLRVVCSFNTLRRQKN
jgi:hypothetical protein